jgi:hypothetical protein
VLKISERDYVKFQEHYAWQLLQSPDYRLGQAFLNYFPDVSREMASTDDGTLLEMKLFYEKDCDESQRIIDSWRGFD